MGSETMERVAERIERKAFPIRERWGEGIGCSLERALPYLIVCRKAGEIERALIANESSYLWAEEGAQADELIREIARSIADTFGALVLVEFWVEPGYSRRFTLKYPSGATSSVIRALDKGFRRPIEGREPSQWSTSRAPPSVRRGGKPALRHSAASDRGAARL